MKIKTIIIGLLTVFISVNQIYGQDDSPDAQAKQLVSKLKSKEIWERAESVYMLASLVMEKNLDRKSYSKEIALLLKDSEAVVREHAVGALSKLNATEYIKDIAMLLDDPDVMVGAAKALGTFKAKEYADKIKEYLKSDNAEVRGNAVFAVAEFANLACKSKDEIQTVGCVKEIAAMLKHDKAVSVRGLAAYTLAVGYKIKDYKKEIAELLKESDPLVKYRAITALKNLDAKEYTKEIVSILKSISLEGDGHLQYQLYCGILDALSSFKAVECIKDVAELLKSSRSDVQSEAAKWLGQMNAKEYTDAIADLVKKSVPNQGAIAALGNLRASEYAEDVAKLLDNPAIKAEAALTLGKMGSQKHAKKISKLLGDTSYNRSWIVQSSLKAIGMLKAAKYSDKVSELLNDQDGSIKFLAILTLGELGATDYKDEIAALLNSANIWIKASAIKALGQLNAKESADEIKKLSNDETKCSIYDFTSDKYVPTTVKEVVKQVLAGWKQ
ncbi:MAG: HEAT repeat domain-containing protein [Planctomycetes bacterium]|nr:HEAT repeat domain-containing protein [Planctomycetota bacterium]